LAHFDELARLLTGDTAAQAADDVAWLQEWRQALSVPRLAAWGLTSGHLAELMGKATVASSMKDSPVARREDELQQLVELAL
jgi:alcohol dehydrogenase class IV